MMIWTCGTCGGTGTGPDWRGRDICVDCYDEPSADYAAELAQDYQQFWLEEDLEAARPQIRRDLIAKQREILARREPADAVAVFTEDEVLSVFQGIPIKLDLQRAVYRNTSRNTSPALFEITVEPMEGNLAEIAKGLLEHGYSVAACGLEDHEVHMQRVKVIRDLVTKHPERPRWPHIYGCEGYHRLVAYYQLGIKTVPVIWVVESDEDLN